MNLLLPVPISNEMFFSLRCSQVFRLIGHILGTGTWEQRKLGELGKIQGGGTPDSGIAEYWDGNVNWFTPTEVSNNGYLESSNRKITSLGLKKSSARLMPASTVLITSRAGVGRMGILKYPASTNQGFQSLILNSATDEYFIYSMQPIISKLANRLASGSTFTEISGKQMEKIEIMIPTTGEQTRISSLMKCINNLIAANEQVPKLVIKIVNNSLANSSFSN
ncbi:type I restriction-modification system,specificity subunit [Lactiplantibacillus plantarum]|nr:type I restriction-modification system,specificity subunit [Lactiplantibacillus plantarum]